MAEDRVSWYGLQSHATVEYTRDSGKASWQAARCESLQVSYAEGSCEFNVARKRRGLAGVPGIEAALTAMTFPVYLARHLDTQKSGCLSWCPSVHIRQRHTRTGMSLLVGHPPCVSYTLHGSSCSHTNVFHDSGVLRVLLPR